MAACATFGASRQRHVLTGQKSLFFVYYKCFIYKTSVLQYTHLLLQQRLTEEKPLESIAQFVHFVLYLILYVYKTMPPEYPVRVFFYHSVMEKLR